MSISHVPEGRDHPRAACPQPEEGRAPAGELGHCRLFDHDSDHHHQHPKLGSTTSAFGGHADACVDKRLEGTEAGRTGMGSRPLFKFNGAVDQAGEGAEKWLSRAG